MAEQRDIKYVNKEFSDLKQSLIEYAKNYFPDSYNDFSPTSPGMMFIEMASYVGDMLSFYQDTQIQETFLQYAKEPANLYTLAYMMGYSPRVTSVAEATLTVKQRVAAVGVNYTPNWDQALKVRENATIKSTVGSNPRFLTTEPVDFTFSSSYDPTDIQIHSLDEGNPAEYELSKQTTAISAEIKTTTETFTVAEKFATVEVEDTDIIGILDITDSDGNEWTEVPFLGQETVFKSDTNLGNDNSLVPNILKLQKVSRRFVTRFTSKGVLQIQFGSGISGQDDEDIVPNPTVIRDNSTYTTSNELFKAYDPTNIVFTDTYGLAPTNTTLTIRYLVGGGVTSNVPSNTITTVETVNTSAVDNTYQGTLSFNNTQPASGGKDGDTVEELRQNSLRSFSEQQRTVTLPDYTVRALSLPSKYGSIAKAFAIQEEGGRPGLSMTETNPLAISLYVLAYDFNGKLTNASTKLKNNLKTYIAPFMPVTDAVDIKDAFVVNIGIKYDILITPNATPRDVLLACNIEVQNFFKSNKWSINQPINLSDVYTLLDKVKGVQTVKNIIVENKAGGKYSQFEYDVKGATKNNVVYPSYDPCIFEIKFPNEDIEGRVTTL